MDKRLMKLLSTRGAEIRGGQMLDIYNQKIQEDVSCTIRTNINTANLHYIVETIKIPQATKKGYIEVGADGVFDWSYPTSTTRRGRVQEGGMIAPTITCNCEGILKVENIKDKNFRIRKLTPRECFRLMGVDDADIDKIQASGISNSQQYKCAGNSIVVDTLYHLFRKIFVETENETQQTTLF